MRSLGSVVLAGTLAALTLQVAYCQPLTGNASAGNVTGRFNYTNETAGARNFSRPTFGNLYPNISGTVNASLANITSTIGNLTTGLLGTVTGGFTNISAAELRYNLSRLNYTGAGGNFTGGNYTGGNYTGRGGGGNFTGGALAGRNFTGAGGGNFTTGGGNVTSGGRNASTGAGVVSGVVGAPPTGITGR